MTKESIIQDEIDNLPPGFAENLGPELQRVVAVLYLHDFTLMRADEVQSFVSPSDDLYRQHGQPSIWFMGADKSRLLNQYRELTKDKPIDNPKIIEVMNRLLRTNFEAQRRMLTLLKEFYANREVDFSTRLIVENIDIDGAYLKSQGANIRPILGKGEQEKQAKEFTAELLAFTDFLVHKLDA